MRENFAGKIRQAAKALGAGGREFRADELGDEAGLQTRSELRRMYRTVTDFVRVGEIQRVGRGIYRYCGKSSKKPQVQLIMWRILRARRTVTIEDLQELAGASAAYVKEWLRMLCRRGMIQKISEGKYRLVQDPVEMPRNEEKAERLRGIREKKRAALAALDRAFTTIENARKAVSQLSDD